MKKISFMLFALTAFAAGCGSAATNSSGTSTETTPEQVKIVFINSQNEVKNDWKK